MAPGRPAVPLGVGVARHRRPSPLDLALAELGFGRAHAWHALPDVSPAAPEAPARSQLGFQSTGERLCLGCQVRTEPALTGAAPGIAFPFPAMAPTRSKPVCLRSQGFDTVVNGGFHLRVVCPPWRLRPVPGLAGEAPAVEGVGGWGRTGLRGSPTPDLAGGSGSGAGNAAAGQAGGESRGGTSPAPTEEPGSLGRRAICSQDGTEQRWEAGFDPRGREKRNAVWPSGLRALTGTLEWRAGRKDQPPWLHPGGSQEQRRRAGLGSGGGSG